MSEVVRVFEEALTREIGSPLPLGDQSGELSSLWRLGAIEIATSKDPPSASPMYSLRSALGKTPGAGFVA